MSDRAGAKYPQATERPLLLIGHQRRKMARSAHAYVRGATKKFYEWLEQSNGHAIPDGPPIWICGDCHVGNLGPVADSKGKVAAPPWLWTSIVDLVGAHERAYLDHCRRFALEPDDSQGARIAG